MLSDYQNREKENSMPMEQKLHRHGTKFSLHETIISCRGNVSFLFQTGCVQDMFDGFTQSGHILTSGCCKMRLTASGPPCISFAASFTSLPAFKPSATNGSLSITINAHFSPSFDSSHEENLFLRIAFLLIWKARSLMASTLASHHGKRSL